MFFSNVGVPLWDHLASSLNLPRRPNLFKVSKQFSVKFNKLKMIFGNVDNVYSLIGALAEPPLV